MRRHTGANTFKRPADAEADAEEILRAEPIDDVLYAVVAGGARRESGPVCPRGDIQIIMDDDDIRRRELIELHERLHRGTGAIHMGIRFYEERFFRTESALCDFCGHFLVSGKDSEAAFPLQEIHAQESRVVARLLVFFPWIAETDDQFHRFNV